jgi:hypothetical protein
LWKVRPPSKRKKGNKRELCIIAIHLIYRHFSSEDEDRERREKKIRRHKQRPRKGRTGGTPVENSGRTALRREQYNGFA